jgi:predicted NAD-dependent protein-ADP-ribosyltransferase YbiA (DUF1768 family)
MEQFLMMKKAEHFGDLQTYSELLQETYPDRHKALERILLIEHKQWIKVEDDIVKGFYVSLSERKIQKKYTN